MTTDSGGFRSGSCREWDADEGEAAMREARAERAERHEPKERSMAEAELVQPEPTLRLTLSLSETQLLGDLLANVFGDDETYAMEAAHINEQIARLVDPDDVVRFEECKILAMKRDEP